jgi:hypothetical protein
VDAVVALQLAESLLSQVLRDIDESYLRPEPGEVAEAERRADTLVTEIDLGRAQMFRVASVYKHGSLSRGTGIRSFRDLDRLVELDPRALVTQRGAPRSAADTIGRMAAYIEDRRRGLIAIGGMWVRRQDHSVGIEYPSGLRIDLVPAIKEKDRLLIPERASGRWIPTDPGATLGRLEQAKRRVRHVGIAIRLLKGWKRARGRNAPISSFALETWAVERALGQKEALDELVFAFFDEVAAAHAGRRLGLGNSAPSRAAVTLVDPVSDNNLTESLTAAHRARLVATCRDARESMEYLVALTQRGAVQRANIAAKNLFVGRQWS